MGWMKAIVTDVEELVLVIAGAADFEQLQDLVRESGWISPTEAGLVRDLIREGGPEQLARARKILGGAS